MLIASILAVVTLALAVSGLYGVMAAMVNEQSREIGVRMALGADPARVVGLVLRRSFALTMVGTTLGVFGAFFLNRLLIRLLFQVEPSDPVTMVVTVLLLLAATLLGTAVPARRAARLDPLAVLREG